MAMVVKNKEATEINNKKPNTSFFILEAISISLITPKISPVKTEKKVKKVKKMMRKERRLFIFLHLKPICRKQVFICRFIRRVCRM